MMYRVVHRTRYRYSAPVSRCRNEGHLRPRDTERQHCVASDLVVEPAPTSWTERTDYFGNPVDSFAVDGPFFELTITSTSSVSVTEQSPPPPGGQPWEEVRETLATELTPEVLRAREFCFESPLVPVSSNVRDYAEPSFRADRPLVDAVSELVERIYVDFLYDPGFTTVTTPLEDVLTYRRGVCQDFAHLAIGCLRTMGLAARYVSGYLETAPPSEEERLVGADATHAWASVFLPGWGWLDVDPTNDQIAGPNYVTTAWGRDYSDVSPVKGIVFGGGDSPLLEVSVDVTRLPAVEGPPEGCGLESAGG
jgi:transglutaminase-like putative cysteine protease